MPLFEVVATVTSYDIAGLDPPEDTCFWFVVEAPNATKAKAAAVKFARENNKEWWYDGESPFAGLEAHDMLREMVAVAVEQGCYIECKEGKQ